MVKRWRRRPRRRALAAGSTLLVVTSLLGLTTAQAAPAQPPQFVVVSFDGGGSIDSWQHWRDVGRRADATMSFFLTGLYLLPETKAWMYDPPGPKPAGSSEVGFSAPENVRPRMEQVRRAYLEGHEIGSHFNGHFCGAGGVGSWTKAQWAEENRQFNSFLTNWRENSGNTDAAPMPFGLDAIVGERTPCLEGDRSALYGMLAEHGFRYDTSNIGGLRWPRRMANGLWDIPLQNLRMAGSGRWVLSMDYNFYEAQSGASPAATSRRPALRQQVLDTYRNAFRATYNGNRAPLILGNHFSRWNGGIYEDALTSFLLETCHKPDVRCVSTRQLVDWMEDQPASTMTALRARPTQTMGW
jgi:hypothetical protein